MEGLALLKNRRETGADGCLLSAVLVSDIDFKIYSFDREGGEIQSGAININGRGGRLRGLVDLVVRLIFLRLSGFQPKVIVCGSQDLSLIAQIAFSFCLGVRKYYLFSDYTGYHKDKLTKPLAYFLDWILIRMRWIPCVTSPGFVSGYLGKLKNKLLFHCLHNSSWDVCWSPQREIGRNSVPVLVWAGLLRCNTSARILLTALKLDPSAFKLKLAGSVENINKDVLGELLKKVGVVFVGRYTPHQLDEIYGDVDYCWACDWEGGLNAKMLVPNRMYHALSKHVPVFAASDSFLGEIVSRKGLGWLIECKDEAQIEAAASQLLNLMRNLSNQDYLAAKAEISRRSHYGNLPFGGWSDILEGRSRSYKGSLDAYLD